MTGHETAAKSDLPDGPFKGVPFLMKDLMATLEGVPTSMGNKLWKDIPAKADSELARRWLASGVIVVGKSQYPRIWPDSLHRIRNLRPGAQPLGYRAHARRFLRRIGRGGGSAHRTDRLRRGRRRLDPHPIVGMRIVRPETHARTHAHRPGCW